MYAKNYPIENNYMLRERLKIKRLLNEGRLYTYKGKKLNFHEVSNPTHQFDGKCFIGKIMISSFFPSTHQFDF